MAYTLKDGDKLIFTYHKPLIDHFPVLKKNVGCACSCACLCAPKLQRLNKVNYFHKI